MNIIFNPLSNNALTEKQLKGNDDIIFDLSGNNIFAKGVKFYGTDTHVEILDVLNSDRTDAALSANMGQVLNQTKVPYNNTSKETGYPSQFGTIVCPTNKTRQGDVPTSDGVLFKSSTGNYCDFWISSDDNYLYKKINSGTWQKIGAGYADSVDWSNITNAPDTLPNPESLIIFEVPYDGSKQVTITPNNYIYKVAKADINTNPITDKMAFIGTYYEGHPSIDNIQNTPLRYSVTDMWSNWLEPKVKDWYDKNATKVNAVLWGNDFTGVENISDSLYLEDGTQIFINNTEIIDYSGTTLYLGYGTKSKTGNNTSLYAANNISLIIGNTNKVSVNSTAVNVNTSLYANSSANVSGGLYLASYKIGTLSDTTQSYTDPWSASNADFRFGGSLAATKIYASGGFWHPNYDSTTGETYLLTANGGTTTVNSIRAAIRVQQNNNGTSYPLVFTDEANTSSSYNSYLLKNYNKLTFNPAASNLSLLGDNAQLNIDGYQASLNLGATTPTSSMWIGGMKHAAINTYSNGYRAWISGSTSSGRLSIGSFGDSTSGTDGSIYFSYATTANINNNTNTVINDIWINPRISTVCSTYYSGYSYTATEGYHLWRNGSDVTQAVLSTDGSYWNLTLGDRARTTWGCIPVINSSDGVMEVGKYIDFHNVSSADYDFATRLQTDGNYGNTVLMPKKDGRLLVESDLSNMYEIVVNLHPSNYVLGVDGTYTLGGSFDENTWYPIEIQLASAWKFNYPVVRGEILAYLDTGYTNSSGTWVRTGSANCSWMTHTNGFSSRIVFETQASGWGTVPTNILRVLDSNQTWCVVNPVRYMVQDYKSSSVVVWCRGYGQYRFRFNYPNVKVVVHTSSFSLGDTDNTYTTYTFSSIINDTTSSSWQSVFDDLNGKLPEIKPTLGYWADIAVSNQPNSQTSPTFYTCWAENMFRSKGNTGWYNETYEDGICMRQSSWIETWAGANIYTSGAMSAGKLLVGLGKSNSSYDLDIVSTNGSRFNGTLNIASTTQNATGVPGINFRGKTSTTYDTWCVQETVDQEALLFGSNYAGTGFVFHNGINYSSITNHQYYNLASPLVIRNNKVFMGYNYASGTSSASCLLNVTSIMAEGFHHKSVDSDNYVLLAGGGILALSSFVGWSTKWTFSDSIYTLSFVKLRNLNNLVWVDGHILKGAASFSIAIQVYPYIYNNDYSMETYYRLSGNDYIKITGNGWVSIQASQSYRIGFFYTGRA